jgi:hypothetical protein
LPQLVYDGDHVQALFDDRGGDSVLVTFNEMNTFADGNRYWGDRAAEKLSISCLGVMTKAKNWFPRRDMQRACERISPLLEKFEARICYGFSQGGYAAVKYSHMLGSSHVLAFSPQWTIDPALLVDPRFNPAYSESLHSGMEISESDTSGKILLFADPFDKRDWVHCQKILECASSAQLIPIRYIGHSSIRAVASTELLGCLLNATTRRDDDIISELQALVNSGKKKSFLYKAVLGQAAAKSGHLTWAQNLYRESCSSNSEHAIVKLLGSMIENALRSPNQHRDRVSTARASGEDPSP